MKTILLLCVMGAAEVGGVKLEDTFKVGDATLRLNGVGLRKKAIFKVYVAGLYLTQPATTADAVTGPDTSKALVMQFVRDVGREKLIGAYREGFDNDKRKDLLKSEIEQFLAAVTDMKEGEQIVFTYEPQHGSSVRFGKGLPLAIAGKAFADAYLQTYVGDKPPTEDLRRGLLGAK